MEMKFQSEDQDFEEEEENEETEFFEAINVSFACEDCDYRWEATFENEEDAEDVQYCPMCGTANTTQI